jgi:predicted MFS family arabinose efflux permease
MARARNAEILGPLRIRNFSLLWSAGLLSKIGNVAFLTGLSYYLYQETGLAAAVSGLVIALSVPGVLFASTAGVIADRWDRKRQMIVVNLVQAAAMLPALALAGDRLWLAYVIMFIDAGAGHFYLPAGEAALPSIVPREQLVRAYSLESFSFSIAGIAGPVVGGVSFAIWGIAGVAIVNALSFVASAALIWPIELSARAEATGATEDETAVDANPEGIWQAFRAGLRQVAQVPGLAASLATSAAGLLGAATFQTILVPLVNDLIGGGNPEGVGFALGARGLGGLTVAVALAAFGARFAPERLLIGALSILAATIVGAAFVSPTFALLLVVVSGIPAVAWTASNMTIVQLFTSGQYKGRIFGLYHTTRALCQIGGALIVLAVADELGLRVVTAIAGVLLAVAAVLALRVREPASIAGAAAP